MADTETKRAKLTDAQKAEVRAVVAVYKRTHPDANLKEVKASLDLPYKDQVTEGVLRGLAARSPGGAGSARGRGGRRVGGDGRSTTRLGSRSGARGGARSGRGRSLEKVIGELNTLRRRRDDLDGQISDLEGEVRERMHQQLGVDNAGRIFGGMLKGLGDAAQRVGSTVGDTAQKVSSSVGGRLSATGDRGENSDS